MRKVFPALIFLCLLLPFRSVLAEDVKLLVILPDQYGANWYLHQDNYLLHGWNITYTGLTATVQPCQAFAENVNCPPIDTDLLLSEIDDITQWDCIVIGTSTQYGGNNPFIPLMNDTHTLELLQQAVANDVVIIAWCAGVRLLAAADVIDGRNVTGSENFSQEYVAAGANFITPDVPPVRDGCIITSTRGQYYSIQCFDLLEEAVYEYMAQTSSGEE